MTPTSQPERSGRRRPARVVTATVVIATAAACALAFGSEGAVAASTPYAQSVGRFLDGSVGGNAIQSLANLKDARAVSPGHTSQQNPLDATLLNALDVPLGHALQLPGGGVFKLGAVNQVAVAKSDGYAYGASGAVSNSGGVSLGGNNGAYPADATIDLSSDALGASFGSLPIPGLPGTLPGVPAGGVGGGSLPALGGIQAQIGAVSGLAQTLSGGSFATPRYQIAGLKLLIGSPALGGLLQTLAAGGKSLTSLLTQLSTALGHLPGGTSLGGADCALTSGKVPSTISLDNGAIVIDPANASLAIDLQKLLQELHLNLNNLPPNTDLLASVLHSLGTILSRGLENVINDIAGPLQKLGDDCLGLLPAPVQTLLGTLFGTLTTGQQQLETAINQISDALSTAGAPGLTALTGNLAKIVAIGVNVQQGAFPLSSEASPTYRFTSALKPTPDQATPVVSGQGVERALEIDLLGGQVALALGNAAAGPSSPAAPPKAAAPPTSNPPTTGAPNTNIPTGIPAGMAGHGGSPALPLTLLVVGLLLAGGGTVAWRLRLGRRSG